MRKLIYFAATFALCSLFGLGRIWLAFTAVLLFMSLLRFEDSFLWEIPLAVLSCSVLEIAFHDDIKIVLQILILFSTFFISLVSPKRLPIFFLTAIFAMFFENTYSIAAVWATLWYGVRSAFGNFITKKTALQEYKL